MIFYNVRYVDTDGEYGMSCASKLVYYTIDLYKKDYERFTVLLNSFNKKYS